MQRILIVSLISGLVATVIASGKGRSIPGWFLLAFLIPLSLLMLIVLPTKIARQGLRNCPYCRRAVPAGAAACPHCEKRLPVNINMVQCPSCGLVVQAESHCSNCGVHLPQG